MIYYNAKHMTHSAPHVCEKTGALWVRFYWASPEEAPPLTRFGYSFNLYLNKAINHAGLLNNTLCGFHYNSIQWDII